MYKDNGITYLKYSAAEADGEAKYNHKKAGRKSKLDEDICLKTFIEDKIKINKWSPEEISGYIKLHNLKFKIHPSFQLIYYWIDRKKLKIKDIDLVHKVKLVEKKEENKREQSESRKEKSIHIRPTIVDENKEFGHWEMDCVEGSKEENEIYLTLLERITKKYIVVKMPDKTNNSVVEAWNNIEKRYGKYFKYVFKTVTTDNGSNFLNYTKIESSINGNTKRFEMYYADPYSAWQKGMNENCNGILRRFIPKGTRIQSVSKYELDIIQYRINEKPRKINGFRSAEELFKEQLSYIMV